MKKENFTKSRFLYVVKFDGGKEPFSYRKVYLSARRVGAPKNLAEKITRTIKKEAYPGIKTLEISRKVKKLLRQELPKAGLKFNLKTGMKKLGPTGFPFERFVGTIFLKNGFEVKLNQFIRGYCCKYEIDFLARKDNLLYIGECKYRKPPKGRVHSDVSLSNYARFLDIKKGKSLNKKNLKIKSLLVTNAKFTRKTIRYSKCTGVELLGWNYPRKKGLEHLIDSKRLYPITILPSLNRHLAGVFASRKMMLAQDLSENTIEEIYRETKIPKRQLELLIREARILLD